MHNIRNYKKDDYHKIMSWYAILGQDVFSEGNFPEESTFILEKDGTPWICLTIYLTNTKKVAFFENVIANPSIEGSRHEAVNELMKHGEAFAKECGYENAISFSNVEKLFKRGKELGYNPCFSNVTIFTKKL